MSDLTADEVIARFNLAPLEGEGGFFRRTWVREGPTPDVPAASAILYLMTPDSFSALHRLQDDELFHFYLGDPCISIFVDETGDLRRTVLGTDVLSGMQVQHLVPGGSWQGTRLVLGGTWALLGTTMSPGFHEGGFELATDDTLRGFPDEVAAQVREFMPPRR